MGEKSIFDEWVGSRTEKGGAAERLRRKGRLWGGKAGLFKEKGVKSVILLNR
jgi:hypothetical protein